jgi:hypothetical protein
MSNQINFTSPGKCLSCKKRTPNFIIRPCNHVILCEDCQKIRFNRFTNCVICFNPIDYLMKFQFVNRGIKVEITKIIEVRKHLEINND